MNQVNDSREQTYNPKETKQNKNNQPTNKQNKTKQKTASETNSLSADRKWCGPNWGGSLAVPALCGPAVNWECRVSKLNLHSMTV